MMQGASVRSCSKLIKTVVTSTMQAEVHALYHCSQDVKWARNLLAPLGFQQTTTPIYEDNQSVIQFSQNYGLSEKNKTIEAKYFAVRQERFYGTMLPIHIDTLRQLADTHTKIQPGATFQPFRDKLLGVRKHFLLLIHTILQGRSNG